MAGPALLSFPLRGVWTALNSPADRVPSHGTEFFAQKYAIDFFRVDERTRLPYTAPVWRHLFLALDASEFLCWDEPVLAAEGGRVVHAGDGWPDRHRVNLAWELARSTFAPPLPRNGDNRPLAGNHVIVEGPSGCTAYAHLRDGSVAVREGDVVAAGDPIGTVGNSGNTTMPHLHFQLMDGPDPTRAKGLPFAFAGLHLLRDGVWQPLESGVPARDELVRS